jgi:putative endonuclease
VRMYRSRVPTGTRASMKFYYVYILHNPKKDFIYIGYSENLKQRLIAHNKGENKSTKLYVPLELIHYEAYKNIKDAKRREMYLKSNKGRTTLITMLREYFKIKQ